MTLVAPAFAPMAKGLAAAANTAPKAIPAAQPEAPRSSGGEASAANLRSETARAVDAAGQSAVAPRLRDQETTERSNRLRARQDAPTGPPPAFEESLLERRWRTAFDPPDIRKLATSSAQTDQAPANVEVAVLPVKGESDTAPVPSELAKAGFAETRAISDDALPATLNVRG